MSMFAAILPVGHAQGRPIQLDASRVADLDAVEPISVKHEWMWSIFPARYINARFYLCPMLALPHWEISCPVRYFSWGFHVSQCQWKLLYTTKVISSLSHRTQYMIIADPNSITYILFLIPLEPLAFYCCLMTYAGALACKELVISTLLS